MFILDDNIEHKISKKLTNLKNIEHNIENLNNNTEIHNLKSFIDWYFIFSILLIGVGLFDQPIIYFFFVFIFSILLIGVGLFDQPKNKNLKNFYFKV